MSNSNNPSPPGDVPSVATADHALTVVMAELTAIKGKLDQVIGKVPPAHNPSLEPMMDELGTIKTKLDGIDRKSESSKTATGLKAIGAVAWLSSPAGGVRT